MLAATGSQRQLHRVAAHVHAVRPETWRQDMATCLLSTLRLLCASEQSWGGGARLQPRRSPRSPVSTHPGR